MRKILPWGASSSVTKVEPKVGGFVSQAEHCEIGSANQVINDYRLDYKGTQFSKNDGFAVIEYDNMGSPMRPYNSKDIDDVTKFDVPNTKTGMTGSDEKIIPEFYMENKEDLIPRKATLRIYDYNGKIIEEYKLNDNLIWIQQ